MASRETRLELGAKGAPESKRQIRVLTLTTLFPSLANPRHGIFIETRLRKLRDCAPVSIEVVAPVPWFPSRWPAFGRYATYAATPRFETRFGLAVHHPRYLMVPRIGMTMQPRALASAVMGTIESMLREGAQFDVVDSHYFYPDGVAASFVAQALQRPLVISARGSDINLIGKLTRPRQAMLRAAESAQCVIAVSGALKRALIGIGVAPAKIEVLRNGVDVATFQFRDRDATRRKLGVERGPLVLSVGNLVLEKGHDLVLEASARVAHAHVAIVGRGPEMKRLEGLAARLGIAARTAFLDNVPQSELAAIYSAADVLALGSQREGWPNVLLESMSCGTPVVAVDVGGVREIVQGPEAGEVVESRSPDAFALAIERVLACPVERAGRRAYAARFDWESISRRYFEILESAAHSRRSTSVRGAQ